MNKLSITSEIEFQADGVCVIQYDNDRCDEFLIHKDFRYYITDQKQVSHFQINIPEENCHFFRCLDLDGKPPRELVFQRKKNDTIWLYIYSGTKLINRFKAIHGKDIRKPEGWDGWLGDVRLIDANDDGCQDLVFTVNSGFDLQPRGIWVYDIRNNHELWHYWIGGSPRSLNVVDVDKDGEDEIVISTTAISNGSIVNGISDSKSYVIVFNKKGMVLWHREIGGTLTDALCWVGDMDGDNSIEIVVAECEGSANREKPNQILILNAQDGKTKKFIRSGDKYMGMIVYDINRDEKQEVIVGNTDGILRIYNSDLTPIIQRDFNTRIDMLAVADLNGDGTDEIIAKPSENKLLFLDECLEGLGGYSSKQGEKIQLSCVCDGRKKKLLVFTGEKPPYMHSLLSFSGPTLLQRVIRSQSPFFAIATVVLLLIVIYMFYQYKQLSRRLGKKEEYTDRILEWSGLAQRLAHDIKNPLSTINLTLQRIQEIIKKKFGGEAKALNKYTNSVLEEVGRLRDTTDKFMRILSMEKPHLEPNDINQLISRTLNKYETRLPKAVKLEKYLAKDLPLIRYDEDQMITVFSNIIENAFEAMGSTGTLTIRTSLSEKITDGEILKSAEIKVEDTGTGIPQDVLENLFRPFHSTKAGGTGLGLVIAKRILEAHKGNIRIESKLEIGTIVTIKLPIFDMSKKA